MPSVTLTIPEGTKSELKRFQWVNWSEVAREEFLKKEIFEKFIRTGRLSENDQKFCDTIGWYPIDELPLKEEFVKEIKKQGKRRGKAMTPKQFKKWSENI